MDARAKHNGCLVQSEIEVDLTSKKLRIATNFLVIEEKLKEALINAHVNTN